MNYKRTINACYMSYISHAVLNNLPALLFALLSRNFGLSHEQLGRLVLINFATRFVIDIMAIRLADKVGYRRCLVTAHALATLGLALFGVLPMLLPNHLVYTGLSLTMVVFSAAGGLIQVLVSPIINQISGHLGPGAMTLLHSFYPWGTLITIICTTIALQFTPDHLWYVIPIAWTIVPLITMRGFATAPMAEPRMLEQPSQPLRELARDHGFLLAVGLMVTAGMTEASMSQWAPFFVERGLGVSRMVGNLVGPGIASLIKANVRMTYGKWEHKFPLERLLRVAAIGSMLCFAGMALIPHPALALAACTLSGATIAMIWPGTVHRSAERFPRGGTAMFGMLALGGDMGAASGPWTLGAVGDRAPEGNNRWFLTGALFPLGYLTLLLIDQIKQKRKYLNSNREMEATP